MPCVTRDTFTGSERYPHYLRNPEPHDGPALPPKAEGQVHDTMRARDEHDDESTIRAQSK